MEILQLDHNAYLDSIARIRDEATRNFAAQAEAWWSRHFSWKRHGCRVLVNSEGDHLSYLFYHVDRYRQYLTIHNIFTPEKHRHNGHALRMLKTTFSHQAGREVKRFHLSSTPQALGFYAELPLIYWGIDTIGNFHCDLPLPETGLQGLSGMIRENTNTELLDGQGDAIYQKVWQNGNTLSEEKLRRFKTNKDFLGNAYRHRELCTDICV